MRRKLGFALVMTALLTTGSASAQKIVATAVPSISGVVFDDANFNQVQDLGEAPYAGWTVTLEDANSNTTTAITNAAGQYTFSPVAAGSYELSATPPLPIFYETFPYGEHHLLLPQGASAFDVNFGFQRTCLWPPQDMRAWWDFDEVSTDGLKVYDRQGGIEGTLVNGPAVAAGKVQNAGVFNGTSQYLSAPDSADLDLGTADFSIDAWVKTTGGNILSIADKRTPLARGYAFFLLQGRLGFQMGDRATGTTCSNSPNDSCTNFIAPASSTLVNDGLWHHVAVTVDRDQPNGGLLYVDGNVVLTFDPTIRPLSLDNNAPLWIARRNVPLGDGYFAGSIDELEIFGRALTAIEIQALVAADTFGKCKPSVCDFPVLDDDNVYEIFTEIGGGIGYLYKIGDEWSDPIRFGTSLGAVDELSAIRTRTGDLEVVVRDGERLVDFRGMGSGADVEWSSPLFFGSGLAGTPSLIQSSYFTAGNFEIVAPHTGGGIAHYWRDNDAEETPWHEGPVFAQELHVDDLSLIQGNFGSPGNFEVVARIGSRLAHFWRDNSDPALPWHGPTFFATGVSGRPSLILGSSGNFEVVSPLANGSLGHWTRDNTTLEWSGPVRFGSGLFPSVVLAEHDGQLRAIAQTSEGVVSFTRDATPPFAWHGPVDVAH